MLIWIKGKIIEVIEKYIAIVKGIYLVGKESKNAKDKELNKVKEDKDRKE